MKRLLPALIIAVLLLAAVRPASAAPASADLDDTAALEAFFDGVLASQLAQYNIAGATVSVVKDGELRLAKGYGYADWERRIPVDPARTLFRPGSISKLFVWTAVMQLVEQGRLDLETDVNEYLDFEIPARLWKQESKTAPRPITLADLMAHTPGFEDVGEGSIVLNAEEMPSLGDYLKTHLPARVFPPGEFSAYSNYGTALAGYIVERVSGIPFEEYVEQHIFTPLGMTHSTFRQPLPAALAGDMSRGYNYTGGAFVPGGFEFIPPYPAGSLSSTAADMARFMIAHLQEGRYEEARILEEDTARTMHTRHFAHDLRLPGMAHGFFESFQNGRRILSHGGDTIHFHSGLYLLPAENVGLFVSYNTTTAAAAREKLLEVFMDRYFPAPESSPPAPRDDFRERAGMYQGEYHMSRANYTTVEKLLALMQAAQVRVNAEGHLLVSLGGETMRFVEAEPGLLRSLDNEYALAVRTDASGRVTHLLPSEPFVLIKAPWYATGTFAALLLVLSLLLWPGTLAGWLIALFTSRAKREKQPAGAKWARVAAVLFGLLFIFILLALAAIFGDIDPAFGVPRIFFGTPPFFDSLLVLPVFLALLGAGTIAFAVLAWWKGYWRIAGRLHYTLLALDALALLGIFRYWNIL